jgi:hypothetical protein
MAPSLCLRCTDKNAVKKVKNILEKENLLNKQRRILQVDNVGFFLPVLTSTCDNGFNEDCMYGDCCFQFDGFRINVIYVFQGWNRMCYSFILSFNFIYLSYCFILFFILSLYFIALFYTACQLALICQR